MVTTKFVGTFHSLLSISCPIPETHKCDVSQRNSFSPGTLMFLFKIRNLSPPQTPSEPLRRGLLSLYMSPGELCAHCVIVDVGYGRWSHLAVCFLAYPDTVCQESCWLHPAAAFLSSRAPFHGTRLPTKGPGSPRLSLTSRQQADFKSLVRTWDSWYGPGRQT